MGKIILEFDSEEEKNDARVALDGYKWKIAMWDLDQLLRGTTKYGVSISDKSKDIELNKLILNLSPLCEVYFTPGLVTDEYKSRIHV